MNEACSKVESLERRQLLSSVALNSSGLLTVTGDATVNDSINVGFSDPTRAEIRVSVKGLEDRFFATSKVRTLRINGLGGHDHVTIDESEAAFTRRVTVDGGAGNDSIFGGAENDYVLGGAGRDDIRTGKGADYVDAGNDNDLVDISGTASTIFGGSGNDKLIGGPGADRIKGGVGNDTLWGFEGNDLMNGDAGNDSLYASDGNDTIVGGTGNDYLAGETGLDKIYDSSGTDTLLGGHDADTMGAGGAGDITDVHGGDRDVLSIANNATRLRSLQRTIARLGI